MSDSIDGVRAMVSAATPVVTAARAAYEAAAPAKLVWALATTTTRPVAADATTVVINGRRTEVADSAAAVAYWDLRFLAKPVVDAVVAAPPGLKLGSPTAVYKYMAPLCSDAVLTARAGVIAAAVERLTATRKRKR
jgi:hypothetical protein